LSAVTEFSPEYQALIEGLKQYPTRSALIHSAFFQQHRSHLDAIIDQIWHQPCPQARPRVRDFIRLTQWNIERGLHLDAICDIFQNHPILQYSDLITLNEVDIGMNRTGNRNIAFELGKRLGMHACFVAEYLEMTKGIRAEAELPGSNREALHGNAILSRYPLRNLRAVRLPSCFDTFEFSEKRYGDRVALIAQIDTSELAITVASTHLEVRYTPACRAKQFQRLLQALPPGQPTVIGGDLNTGTFKRGNLFHSVMGFVRLVRGNPVQLAEELRHPERTEPLFALARAQGYQIAGFNDDLPTCSTPLGYLDEARQLPERLQKRIDRQLARYDHRLDFRLDFILAAQLTALDRAERSDSTSKIVSQRAQTLQGLSYRQQPISDHDPIFCDLKIPF
jgi:endonuclease/exonuclease/phosphatase family metal-dependent hydrolase